MSRAGGSWGCAALACETWRGSIFHNNERIFEQADNYLDICIWYFCNTKYVLIDMFICVVCMINEWQTQDKMFVDISTNQISFQALWFDFSLRLQGTEVCNCSKLCHGNALSFLQNIWNYKITRNYSPEKGWLSLVGDFDYVPYNYRNFISYFFKCRIPLSLK